jgi:DNA-binding LacI/PurR family transcriptional regulator
MVMPPYQAQTFGRVAEPFILNLVGGITRAMRERGLTFQISHRVAQDQRSLRALIEERPQDGYLFLGQSQFHEALNEEAKRGRAFVVWGAQREGQRYCSVGTDNFQGGLRATSHLLRLGRKHIAFVGNTAYFEVEDRFRGYRTALKDHGLPYDPNLVIASELGIEDGLEAAQELASRDVPFDALFAATDMLAFGLMRAFTRSGRRIPTDVSVVGYDDIDSAQHSSPALTTIRQDPLQAGRLMTLKLIRLMGGQSVASEAMPAELIVRESCGA